MSRRTIRVATLARERTWYSAGLALVCGRCGSGRTRAVDALVGHAPSGPPGLVWGYVVACRACGTRGPAQMRPRAQAAA